PVRREALGAPARVLRPGSRHLVLDEELPDLDRGRRHGGADPPVPVLRPDRHPAGRGPAVVGGARRRRDPGRPRRPGQRPGPGVVGRTVVGGRQPVGRPSKKVVRTIVVRVETLAVARIRASRSSRATGDATRTFSTYDSSPATEWQASISDSL